MKTLKEAIAERDAFLEEHPHLKAFQKVLDKATEDMTIPEKLQYYSLVATGNIIYQNALTVEVASGALRKD